jgi:four helix bundle protein
MTPDDLKAKTKKSAADAIRYARSIPSDPINQEIACQLTDAATSTAAHYRAACRARSRRDFINKLGGAMRKCDQAANHHSTIKDHQPIANQRPRDLQWISNGSAD